MTIRTERDEVAAIIMQFGYATIGVTPTAQAATALASLIVMRKRAAAVPSELDVERLSKAMDGLLTKPPDRLHNARYVAMRYAAPSLNEDGRPPEVSDE